MPTKNSTSQTIASVADYLDGISDMQRRKDVEEIMQIMHEVTGKEARLWGTGMVGFGTYHYKYASGHEGDACLTGLASRAKAITIYLGSDDCTGKDELLETLGKHSCGKGCLYIKKLSDVDKDALRTLICRSVEHIQELYPA